MNAKEDFLKIETYEEFDRRRSEFKELKVDRECAEHIAKIFPKPTSNLTDELRKY